MDSDHDFTFSKGFAVDSMQARAGPQAFRISRVMFWWAFWFQPASIIIAGCALLCGCDCLIVERAISS